MVALWVKSNALLMLTVPGSHSREAGLEVFSVSVAAAFSFLLFSVIVRAFYLFVCLF